MAGTMIMLLLHCIYRLFGADPIKLIELKIKNYQDAEMTTLRLPYHDHGTVVMEDHGEVMDRRHSDLNPDPLTLIH